MTEGPSLEILEENQRRTEARISELHASLQAVAEQLVAMESTMNKQFESLHSLIGRREVGELDPSASDADGLIESGRMGNSIQDRISTLDLELAATTEKTKLGAFKVFDGMLTPLGATDHDDGINIDGLYFLSINESDFESTATSEKYLGAFNVFEEMPTPLDAFIVFAGIKTLGTAPWSSIVAVHGYNGVFSEAFSLFMLLQLDQIGRYHMALNLALSSQYENESYWDSLIQAFGRANEHDKIVDEAWDLGGLCQIETVKNFSIEIVVWLVNCQNPVISSSGTLSISSEDYSLGQIQNELQNFTDWEEKVSKSGIDDLVLEDLWQMINGVESKLRSIGDGEISISAYDTAWVALVPDLKGSDGPQFPSSLQWLIDNHQSDGSWGLTKIFSSHDRLINTLECVIALKSWSICPERCQRGLIFLEENIHRLAEEDEELMSIGFEVAFPSLIDMAKALNLEFPYDGPAFIYECSLGRYGVTQKSVLKAYFLAMASIFEPGCATERLGWAKTAILAEAVTSYFGSELTVEESSSEDERVKGHKTKKMNTTQLKSLQQELNDLLRRPLQQRAFSHRFLDGAGISSLVQEHLEQLSKRKSSETVASKEKRAQFVVIGQDYVEPLQALRTSSHETVTNTNIEGFLRTYAQVFKEPITLLAMVEWTIPRTETTQSFWPNWILYKVCVQVRFHSWGLNRLVKEECLYMEFGSTKTI